MCLHRQCTQHPCSGKDPALKKDQKDKNRRTRICASSFTMDAVLLICRSGLLSRMLNIPQSDFNTENYWNILMRIHNSMWFSDNSHVREEDKAKKWYQAALLDILSYEE